MGCYSGEEKSPSRWLHSAGGSLLATQSGFDVSLSPASVYWEGDLQRELLVRGRLYDFESNSTHLDGIWGDQVAWADILGDWREEIIVAAKGEIRMYSTPVPANDRRVCLMQDPTGPTWRTSPWAIPSSPWRPLA